MLHELKEKLKYCTGDLWTSSFRHCVPVTYVVYWGHVNSDSTVPCFNLRPVVIELSHWSVIVLVTNPIMRAVQAIIRMLMRKWNLEYICSR